MNWQKNSSLSFISEKNEVDASEWRFSRCFLQVNTWKNLIAILISPFLYERLAHDAIAMDFVKYENAQRNFNFQPFCKLTKFSAHRRGSILNNWMTLSKMLRCTSRSQTLWICVCVQHATNLLKIVLYWRI